MKQRSLPAAAVLAALALALAACAGSGATGGAGSSAPSGGAGAGSPVAAANPGSGGCANPAAASIAAYGGAYASVVGGVLCGMQDIAPCSMLKTADVQALFSVPLKAKPDSDQMGTCDWGLTDPNKGEGLDVQVTVGDPHGLAMDLSTATPLTGVGDRAGWDASAYYPHVGAIKGQTTCELSIGGGDGQLSVPTSGQGVFAKISPAALPGFMQQYGNLCNEIFAGLGA